MIYTLHDIATHISPGCLDLGWQLFSEGRVTAPNIQREGELVTAIIPQLRIGGRPLQVYVRTHKQGEAITIHGQCSCPLKNNCEHVAAVLLQALEDRGALPDETAPAPPAKPLARITNEHSELPSTQQTLLYVLQFDKAGISVETLVARRTKHGFSVTGHYAPGRRTRGAPARFLTPIDIELLRTLSDLPSSPSTGLPQLSGPHSGALLTALVDTGRCYFENATGQPLKRGPERALEFQWLADDYGHQRAHWRITPAADALLPLSSPWYIDSGEGACGPLSTALPPELIQELATAPPVPPQQADAVHKRLRQTYPDAPVPPLQHFKIHTAPRTKPVPCLRLTSVDEDLWGDLGEHFDYASLSFDYGGMELTRHSPATRLVDGKLVLVQRDKKAEQAAVTQLHTMGLEEDEDWHSRTGLDVFVPADYDRDEISQWLDFQIERAPVLQAQGWRIDCDAFRYRLSEVSNWHCHVERAKQQDWFDIGLSIEVDGQRLDLLPILLSCLRQLRHDRPDKEMVPENFLLSFVDTNGAERLLRLPAERVLPLLDTLREIFDDAPVTAKKQLRLSRVQLARLTALDQDEDGQRLHWRAEPDIQQLIQRLRNLDGVPAVAPPARLAATLRPYQQQGLNWLQFLREYRLAGILADDMGLGKTLQALAHLLLEKEACRADRPSLVIAPTSLMFNWRHEAARFAPSLKVLVLHGPQREAHFPAIPAHDLVITTYPLLARDKEKLLAHQYHLLILDEAQVIKNPKAQASHAVRELDARHRLCLTGTPMENHLGELWSLFDFLLPGLLGDSKQFRRFFRTPIETHGHAATSERLSRRIRPFLLRRTKQQVATELPPKTEIIQTVALEGKQRELYETVRLAVHQRVREEIARQGLARSHIIVLDALLKLRQVCCDPRLVNTEHARAVQQSAKLDMLMDLLPEMIEEGRRILVFSQFTAMLDLIEAELGKAKIDYVKLTGQTRDRETPVRRFQNSEVPVFLISLKAGGVGLNLTNADTVIHYDPWWNPAVERQATDRAHRIGQQQSVFVYKLICEDTLEEKIQAMQQRKQALADGLYQTDGANEPQWTEQDLDELFGPLGP
ncbi:MAG: DEAD/DEAH box helicase [Pseudomonadota bacterium]